MKERYSIVVTRRGFPTYHEWHSWTLEQLNHYVRFMHDAGWSLDIYNCGLVA